MKSELRPKREADAVESFINDQVPILIRLSRKSSPSDPVDVNHHFRLVEGADIQYQLTERTIETSIESSPYHSLCGKSAGYPVSDREESTYRGSYAGHIRQY